MSGTVTRTNRAAALPLLTIAASVAGAYYLGVQIGMTLRFPPATTSILWPPNATLTAALLLVPVRRWWVCLLAAFPVHVVAEIQAGFSPAMVLLLFATNCSEAIIAAGGVRLFNDAPARLDTFRRVLVFIACAGIAAPMLSSFVDAAIIWLAQGERYWTVWQTRAVANMLTELSVVPVVLMAADRLGQPLRQPLSRVLWTLV